MATDGHRREPDANRPEVYPGQIWSLRRGPGAPTFPRKIKIVAPYPFTEPRDERLWVIEAIGPLDSLLRLPENSLHQIYELGPAAV
jgi:hypothetical protein